MKKILLGLILVLFGSIMTGCNGDDSKKDVSTIEIIGETAMFNESFQLSDLSVKVTTKGGTESIIPLSETMISVDDIAKLNTEGTHTIHVTYLNTSTTFTITITGEKGADGTDGTDGREVKLQVADGYIQWQYDGDSSWNNLIAVANLMGETPQVSFQVADGFIQFKSMESGIWSNLIAISSLNGTDGLDGLTPVITISEDGFWVINGVVTTSRATPIEIIEPLLTVTFDTNGGTMPLDHGVILANVEQGSRLDLPIPTKEGYVFGGWMTGSTVNDGQFTRVDLVTEDITLYAKWELDYSIIESFLMLFSSDNYTIDSKQEFYESDYEPYYLIETSHTSIETVDEIEYIDSSTHTSESYYGVAFESDMRRYCSYRYELTCLNSDLDSWYITERFNFYDRVDYSHLDFTKFEKEEGSNIYTYTGEGFEFFGPRINLSMIPYPPMEIIEFSFNLDLMTTYLTITDDMDDSTRSEYREYTISEVGTTEIEIPFLDAAKIAYHNKLESTIEHLQNYNYATVDSMSNLMLTVDNISTSIENASNLDALLSLNFSISMLNSFMLVKDDLKYSQYNAITIINSILQDMELTATAVSYEEIQVLADTAIQSILTSETNDAITLIINNFSLDSSEEYVDDVGKLELIDNKTSMKNTMYIVTTSHLGIEGYDVLYELYYRYCVLIDAAKTEEEINSLYSAWYDILLASDLQIDFSIF